MEFSQSIKMYSEMVKNFILIFFAILGGIILVNFITNSLLSNFGEITIDEASMNLALNLIIGSVICAFVYSILSATFYNDILLMFSISKKSIFKTQSFYNLMITLMSTAIFNLSLLKFNIDNRFFYLIISFVLIYTLVNINNFLVLIGKLLNWMFVLGFILIFISLLILSINPLFIVISQGFYAFQVIGVTLIINGILIFFNSINFKKIELIN